ncbi:hypothetical protein A9Q94_09810 [Rhodobacterales bacterium 56_14_T64]|nr:hypothetical protein A9Q94_09810 [Rhodobacterales bacterium 56_14_T64]
MVTIHIIDAFTGVAGTGNRAGVVLDADGLTTADMQAIAGFAGFSETAFILSAKGEDHDLHVRYFTPSIEVPICGHATIASHFLRTSLSGSKSYPVNVLTGAGILPVGVSGRGKDLRVSMTQGAVDYGPTIAAGDLDDMAVALGMKSADYHDGLPAQIVSTGHSKVIIPIRSRQVLDTLEPNPDALTALSQKIGCNGFFPFALEGTPESPETYGRMFAPAIGIFEDPVTGNANGPTAAYLVKHGVIKLNNTFSYQGHQGHKMGRPGTVHVTLSKAGPDLKVQVSGQAVRAGELIYRP